MKTNCQAKDSSKKTTNEFVFTSIRRVFVRFLEESSASRKKRFEIYRPLSQDVNFFFSIHFSIFLWYELSACPLILNSNKVYFPSSLIAKPTLRANHKWGLGFTQTKYMKQKCKEELYFMFFNKPIISYCL